MTKTTASTINIGLHRLCGATIIRFFSTAWSLIAGVGEAMAEAAQNHWCLARPDPATLDDCKDCAVACEAGKVWLESYEDFFCFKSLLSLLL